MSRLLRRLLPWSGEAPYPVYIQKGGLVRYGYSEGCAKCDRLRAGRPASGFRHSEACRRRIERELREAGDRRVEAAERRLAERVIEVGGGGDPSEPAEPAVAAEAEPAAEEPAGATTGRWACCTGHAFGCTVAAIHRPCRPA